MHSAGSYPCMPCLCNVDRSREQGKEQLFHLYKRLGKATMNLDFEQSLCLGSGIAFAFLLICISVSNGFIMVVLYKNPLRCFRKSFSMFLVFIAAVDLFIGTVVCSGEAVMRLLCAFGDGQITQDGDVVRVLGYFGINIPFYWLLPCQLTDSLQLSGLISIVAKSSPEMSYYSTRLFVSFPQFLPRFSLQEFRWIFTV